MPDNSAFAVSTTTNEDCDLGQNSAYGAYEPEQQLDYYSWLKKEGKPFIERDTGPWSRLIQFLTGSDSKNKSEYEAYVENLKNRNEYYATQAANQWDAMRDDSTVQRVVADYEKAGLNPYLLLNNGGSFSGSGSSAHVASYGRKSTEKNSSKGRDAALILLAVARLVAALV